MPSRYADIVLDLPLDTALSYRIPKPLQSQVAIGQRVWVPLRNRQAVGCIVGLAQESPLRDTRPVQRVIDSSPILPMDLLRLSEWIAHTYVCSRGQALYAMLPGPLRRGRTEMASRTPWQPSQPPPTQAPTLTTAQAVAVQHIRQALDARRHAAFLLHGVTGSGKTEVYLAAIRQTLSQGQDCIVLVPEIALTPQTIERFTARFGTDQVAVLHSAMRDSHRVQEWHRIAGGKARVVIGARSAIFATVHHLGLVVVDEEYEATYKQEDTPRYHARETAVERARLNQAVIILGSATPSLEAYDRARRGVYTLLTLPERIDRRPLPRVEIVDLRQQFGQKRQAVCAPQLERALEKMLAERQQAILLLNRRGYSTFIHCIRCGFVARCPDCQATYTFHQATQQLMCHHCRRREPAPDLCPGCQGRYVRFRGTGTQRVESELARLFPTARIARMDSDTMRRPGQHEAILTTFRRGELDILIGTQMVAKGHDFPQVTLIGVINADTALHLPDFRASERTFDLLTQVAGRAGRGHMPGRVIVQTMLPEHEAIVQASRHDYEAFYHLELEHRKTLNLPPLAALALVTVRARREETAKQAAHGVAQQLRQTRRPAAAILGPSPAHVYRIRRQYRWQLLVRSKTLASLLTRLEPLRHLRRLGGAQVLVDVDPWTLW